MPCNITPRGGTRCSQQAAANYGPAACAPQKNKSLLHRWLNFSGGFATSDARAALPFLLFTFLVFDPKSIASAELAQAVPGERERRCANRSRSMRERPRPGYIGRGLQNVELCPQSGSEIAFGHL